jgi:hypothetical protein
MNAKQIRNRFRAFQRQPGFFQRKVCCPVSEEGTPSSFCTEGETLSFLLTEAATFLLLPTTGFWTYQLEGEEPVIVSDPSGSVLGPGSVCIWSSDDAGVPTPSIGEFGMSLPSGSFSVDASRVDGSITDIYLWDMALTSVPVISPSTVSTININTISLLTDADLSLYTNASTAYLINIPTLTSVTFPSSATSPGVSTCSSLINLDLTSMSLLNYTYVQDCASLEFMDVRTGGQVVSLGADQCPSLTIVLLMTDGTAPSYIGFTDCALSLTTMNDLMVYLESIGFVGTGIFTGGTSATPTGAGLAAMNSMNSNGATITVN